MKWHQTHKEENRARVKAWRLSNPQKKQVTDAAYRHAHVDELRATRTAYKLSHKRELAQKKRGRDLWVRYRLTLEAWEAMLIAQAGRCANPGCRCPLIKKAEPHVDHDHITGKVRGLLCQECNTALGLLRDALERLLGLAAYLEGSRS